MVSGFLTVGLLFPTTALAGTTVAVSGNGAHSSNSVTAHQSSSSWVSQSNSAHVSNSVDSHASSGGNSVWGNTGGGVHISTGDAHLSVHVSNWLNTNVLSGWHGWNWGSWWDDLCNWW